MKKPTVILLMLMYALSSSGMTLTIHYCMNDVAGWNLREGASVSSCSNCGMKTDSHKGCCHNERKTIKTQKDQNKIAVYFDYIKAPYPPHNRNSSVYPLRYLLKAIKELPYSSAAPPLCKIPFYISNRVFRV